MSWRRETRAVQQSRARTSVDFASATDRFLAPLICRLVHAVQVLGAGLGFPVGGTFGFTTPTSDEETFVLKKSAPSPPVSQNYGRQQ